MVEHKEFGVSLGKFKAFVCTSCGERFYPSDVVDRIQARSKEKGLFGLARKSKVAEVGNSVVIRVPKAIAQFLGIKKGMEVLLLPKEGNKLEVEV